ncbi:unnamed protein product [marine sediment metagenome]|uniref:Uncharacterized protein n=1 Tax=marine sediment metagenome TaxID=412755 RepID=X1TCB7_9ZZZZ
MPYDKYRNWKTGTFAEMNKLKELVLKDIQEAGDEIEKLEILDSFEAAVERAHTVELAEHLSNQILFIVQPFLTAAIEGKLPAARPISRPRAAPPTEIKD